MHVDNHRSVGSTAALRSERATLATLCLEFKVTKCLQVTMLLITLEEGLVVLLQNGNFCLQETSRRLQDLIAGIVP